MYIMAPYLARRAILSARRAVFIIWRPARRMYVSAKFTRLLLCGSSVQTLNLTASRAAKNQEPSKKAPDKILRLKIKSGSYKLAQKSDL